MDISFASKFISHLNSFYVKSVHFFEHASLLEKAIVLESVLVVSLICVLLLFHKARQKHLVGIYRIQKGLRNYLVNKIETHEKYDPEFFEKNMYELNIIVPVIEKLNDEYSQDVHWLYYLDEILENYLFPLARKRALSLRWTTRNWALRCLSLSPRFDDEHLFLGFLFDPKAHNRFASIRPLLNLKSPYSANSIVDVMSGENRHTQAIYIAMMKFGGDRFFDVIRKRLMRESDSESRRVCIDILSESLNNSDIFLIQQDIRSHDKALKLTAIRCLNKFKVHHATQLLVTFLDDEDWEARSLASKFLGDRKAIQAIPKLLKNASDKNWWVRMNSILSLKQMGMAGESALETITPDGDRFAYEMLQHLNTIEWENKQSQSNIHSLHDKSKKKVS